MKRILFACLLLGTVACRAEGWTTNYAQQGELIVAPFATAPFPHPKRAEGHNYKTRFFSADEHYTNNTVAIFIPKGFRETGKVDFVVHFHGWGNHVSSVFKQYHLVEQLIASGRNAVLIVPQGPYDASDSFGGKLEDPDGFKKFMAEAVDTLKKNSSLKNKDFAVGDIILSGHSGGYEVISMILDRGGMSDKVREVWLFDALYAQTDKYNAWIEKQPTGRYINIYTPNGGTKTDSEEQMKGFKTQGKAFFSGTELEVKPSDLQTNHIVFIFTDLQHNNVLDQRQEFRDYLKTSFLGERDP